MLALSLGLRSSLSSSLSTLSTSLPTSLSSPARRPLSMASRATRRRLRRRRERHEKDGPRSAPTRRGPPAPPESLSELAPSSVLLAGPGGGDALGDEYLPALVGGALVDGTPAALTHLHGVSDETVTDIMEMILGDVNEGRGEFGFLPVDDLPRGPDDVDDLVDVVSWIAMTEGCGAAHRALEEAKAQGAAVPEEAVVRALQACAAATRARHDAAAAAMEGGAEIGAGAMGAGAGAMWAVVSPGEAVAIGDGATALLEAVPELCGHKPSVDAYRARSELFGEAGLVSPAFRAVKEVRTMYQATAASRRTQQQPHGKSRAPPQLREKLPLPAGGKNATEGGSELALRPSSLDDVDADVWRAPTRGDIHYARAMAVRACMHAGRFEQARAYMLKAQKNIPPEEMCGHLNAAMVLLETAEGEAEQAFSRLNDMESYGQVATRDTYAAVIGAFASRITTGEHVWEVPQEIFQRFRMLGLRPHRESFHAIMACAAAAGRVGECTALMAEMQEEGYAPNTRSFEHIVEAIAVHAAARASRALEGGERGEGSLSISLSVYICTNSVH